MRNSIKSIFEKLKNHLRLHHLWLQHFWLRKGRDVLNKDYVRLQQKKSKLLRKQFKFANSKEKKHITEDIHTVDDEIHAFLLRNNISPEYANRIDLSRYYRNIRIIRPISISIILGLWGLLFLFGGLSTSIQIFIFFIATGTTLGNIFELIFLMRIRDRILKPVDELKNGVDEIANGNYDVKIDSGTISEINALTDAFNKMSTKLKEDEVLKSEYEENRKVLIANISHDLKTPITAIRGYIEALLERDDLTNEKKIKYFKIIASNADYMNNLIDDLFLFSKLDMQKLDFNFEIANIRSFFYDMIEEFRLDFEEKNISFEYRDDLIHDCKARIDPKRFHQVIQNIVGNAVRYGQKEGLEISVKLYQSAELSFIDISNNGPEIPEEKLSRIFERFYRVDSERTKNLDGTGLGLAIARELVEAHGGKISVTNKFSGGVCFTIALPIMK